MPQMMPLIWSILLIFTLMITLTTISFFHFNLSLSTSHLTPLSKLKKIKWNWLW